MSKVDPPGSELDSGTDLGIVLNSEPENKSTSKSQYVRIFMDASVRQQIIEFAATDTSHELGGVLIGYLKQSNPAEVFVEAIIPAKYTESVKASITFTHATWEDIHAVKD
ncbi:MAG: hypothetical protein WCO51_13255, partial [bacterium]